MSTQLLGKNAFLAGLTSEDFSLLRNHLSQKDLHAGVILHRYGETVDDVLFPHSGVVAMTLPFQQERGAAVGFVGFEGVIGGFAATASAPAGCDCEVLIAGQATRLSASAFRHALDCSPTLRHRTAQFGNALLAQAQRIALCNAAHSVEARICRCLLEMQDRVGGDRIAFTQDTLARLLGVRRTTITLVAGRLEMAGALNCRRGYMQIIDRDVIERHCCECYAHAGDYTARLLGDRSDIESPRLIAARN